MSAEQYGLNLLEGVREEGLEQVSLMRILVRGEVWGFPLHLPPQKCPFPHPPQPRRYVPMIRV